MDLEYPSLLPYAWVIQVATVAQNRLTAQTLLWSLKFVILLINLEHKTIQFLNLARSLIILPKTSFFFL